MNNLEQLNRRESSSRSITSFLDEISGSESSNHTLSTLWSCLQSHNFIGFAYYCITGKSQCISHGTHQRSDVKSREAGCVYASVFRRFKAQDLLTRRVISAERSEGSYIVCPVFGPYFQNAIFIVHAPFLPDRLDEKHLQLIDLVLQKAHVAIAEYESKQWEERLSLSKREEQILTLMSNGSSNRAIAEKLGISVHTINAYVRRILLKLNSKDRVTACRIGLTIPKVAINSRKAPAKIHNAGKIELMAAG